MPATDPRTATAITRTLRQLWPTPMRLATTIKADGTAQITVGSGGQLYADALGPHLEHATGRAWTFTSVRRLAGNGAAIRIIYTPDTSAATRQRIIDAYAHLTQGQTGVFVNLCDLRDQLPGTAIDNDLIDMYVTQQANLVPRADNAAVTDADRSACVHVGDEDKHRIAIFELAAPVAASSSFTSADTSEASMTHGPITAAAITAGTEAQCAGRTYNCPKRADHPGDCVPTEFTWNIPADWTLANQAHFSRQLDHGAYVARDMETHPSFGTEHMPTMFTNYDKASRLELGRSVAALAAYADFLAATVAAVAIQNGQKPTSADADAEVDALRAAVELHQPQLSDKYGRPTDSVDDAKTIRCGECRESVPVEGCKTWRAAHS
jgi:hypothetical protein